MIATTGLSTAVHADRPMWTSWVKACRAIVEDGPRNAQRYESAAIKKTAPSRSRLTSSSDRHRLQYGARMTDAAMTHELTIVPATEASWEDLRAVFGTRGCAAVCQCQRFKMRPRSLLPRFPLTNAPSGSVGRPTLVTRSRARRVASSRTSTVSPSAGARSSRARPTPGLVRINRVPWAGRAEEKTDASVWAVTCFFTRAGFRGQGISYALARAAVDFARRRGARALEGYPMITKPGTKITWDEIHVGSRRIFAAAGFTEVSRPTLRRVVMRIDFYAGPKLEELPRKRAGS
jgi:GNAT superfamily N-acetyltransferase